MRRTHRVVAVVAILLLVGANATAIGYLKYDGVDGESKGKGHKGQIDIESWSFGSGNASDGPGGGECREVEREPLVVTKVVDSTSAVFADLASRCETTAAAVLEVEIEPDPRSNPPVQRVMRIHLRGVSIARIEMESNSPDELPTESLSLNYEEVEFEVVEVVRGQ